MLAELMSTMRELADDPVLLFTLVLVGVAVAGAVALILRNLGKHGLLVIIIILLTAMAVRGLFR